MNPDWVAAVSAVITAIATGVMIWAVFVAPRKAFEAQWELQQRQESRKRRTEVFTALMATRGNVLNHRHVEALNLIDVEFSDVSEKDIRKAWKTYLDHLNTLSDVVSESDGSKAKNTENQREERRKDLLAELLQKMGAQLSYGFDFTYLKNRAYYPQGHSTEVAEQSAIRKGLIQLLWKGRPLIVRAALPSIEPPLDEEKQKL